VLVQPGFDPEVDSRPGLDARNLLLCPLVHERQMVGMLQLVNRSDHPMFSAEDANLVTYLAERLAERIHLVRRRSHPPVASR
jgi:GAF domain-containing protein